MDDTMNRRIRSDIACRRSAGMMREKVLCYGSFECEVTGASLSATEGSGCGISKPFGIRLS